MEYEMIREIFNLCSGNQMRDVFVSEVKTESPDEYIKQFLVGGKITCQKTEKPGGIVVFDVVIDGLTERYTFTPV